VALFACDPKFSRFDTIAQHVTERWTDRRLYRHTMTAYTTLAYCHMVKLEKKLNITCY